MLRRRQWLLSDMAAMTYAGACAAYLMLIQAIEQAIADMEADGEAWIALQSRLSASDWPEVELDALSDADKAELANLIRALQQAMASFTAAGQRWDMRQKVDMGVLHQQRRILDKYSA